MPSSVIQGFEYDPGKRQLQITFVSGRVYAYEGVPPRTYAAFAAAPSKGSFFNHHIRDHYRFREIKRAG